MRYLQLTNLFWYHSYLTLVHSTAEEFCFKCDRSLFIVPAETVPHLPAFKPPALVIGQRYTPESLSMRRNATISLYPRGVDNQLESGRNMRINLEYFDLLMSRELRFSLPNTARFCKGLEVLNQLPDWTRVSLLKGDRNQYAINVSNPYWTRLIQIYLTSPKDDWYGAALDGAVLHIDRIPMDSKLCLIGARVGRKYEVLPAKLLFGPAELQRVCGLLKDALVCTNARSARSVYRALDLSCVFLKFYASVHPEQWLMSRIAEYLLG